MDTELFYLLKINIALIVFYACYKLFFYRDTFFLWRRIVLLTSLFVSVCFPFFSISSWKIVQDSIAQISGIYTSFLPEVVITGIIEGTGGGVPFIEVAGWIYLAVALLLLVRFLLQLMSIVCLRYTSSVMEIKGVSVLLLNNTHPPFSFFKWIFLHPSLHTEEGFGEILIHEQAHVNQWHSVDVLCSELLIILCWFNPFAWLLKREVRSNLEFLADQHVLAQGCNSKVYQYHLLGLAYQQKKKEVATLYNNFNVLSLKKRIQMMNKKRTKQTGRIKYLLFVPLTALLLFFAHVVIVACSNEKPSSAGEQVISVKVEGTDAGKEATANKEIETPEEEPYTAVEEMPKYPEGDAALMKYISSSINYPAEAQKKGIQGRVILGFVVSKEGDIKDITVLRGVDPLLDNEAIRIVSLMSKWIPGKQGGKNVAVRYTLPLTFKLQ